MKIAISGKGGVGKTTIMALLANQFKKVGKDVLLIDADPSPQMAQTIGFEDVEKITPIAEMTSLLVERSGKTPGSPFYQINPKVDDLPEKFMVEHNGIRLMVLGAIQVADGGCACPENTVLRRLLTKLLLSPSQIVLLDMEAGVEHLGRGTIAGIDHLLIVVTPTRSSVRTAQKIKKLATEVQIPKISFVGNLIKDKTDEKFLSDALEENPVGYFADIAAVRKAERDGQAITNSADETGDVVEKLVRNLLQTQV